MASSSYTDLAYRVDAYIEELFCPPQENLSFALDNMRRNNLPEINVSANEGKLLYLLAKLSGTRRMLEIGTLGGYSTLWLAQALPTEGYLLSLEYDAKHARVARETIAHANLATKVEVRHGDAKALLPQLVTQSEPLFDLIFIDADKTGYPVYLEWALKLIRPGGLILTDNVIRGGIVMATNLNGRGEAEMIARFNKALADNPRLETIIVPLMRDTVDGLAISRVKEQGEE